jgi:hypothetical protein
VGSATISCIRSSGQGRIIANDKDTFLEDANGRSLIHLPSSSLAYSLRPKIFASFDFRVSRCSIRLI